MSDSKRPISRWSTSMSNTTKSTGTTHQTIPLINLRQKLFRQSANTPKNYAQRKANPKHDIEELFKLYYSNNIKFDTFRKQIVTGTHIPTTRQSSSTQNNLNNSSTSVFNSKHCVSREQLSNADSDCNETTPKQPLLKRAVHIRIENNSTTNTPTPTARSHPFPSTTTPVVSNQPISTPSAQQDELSDSPLVKSVTFLEDIPTKIPDNINTQKNQSYITPRSKSSLLTLPPAPPPSFLLMNNHHHHHRKDSTILSHTTTSTGTSLSQQKNQPTVVTGSAVIVRQRSPTKSSCSRQRSKSNMTTVTNSTEPQSTEKNRSPSISSPLSIQPDMPEFPVFVGTPRVVSIPSKCSRFVLVTFPEVPLRYNAPSYVERLLLPERFPTLFQNIVHSYDQHIATSIPHHRNT